MTFKSSLLYSLRLIFSKQNRSEKSNGHRSLAGAMICIGISLVPLISIISISDGMIEGITGRIIHLSSHDLMVECDKESAAVSDCENFLMNSQKLLLIEGIEEVYPEVRGTALAAGRSYRTGASIRGVERDIFTRNESFSSLFKIVEGSTDLSAKKTCILGEKISSLLNVKVGDSVKLISVNSVKRKLTPKLVTYKVGGIVSSGYQELDALWVFIPIDEAFSSIAASTCEFDVGLVTKNPFSKNLYLTSTSVQEFIDKDDSFSDSVVYRWDEVNASEFENFSSTKSLLLIIMLLIVLVASINISSALVMIVMERKKEIAILKSVGGSSRGISLSFIIVGFAAGLGGVVFGVPVGILISANINSIILAIEKVMNLFAKMWWSVSMSNTSFHEIHVLDPAYYLQEIPVTFPAKDFAVIVAATLVLSVIVSIVPSLKAGNEKPIETLRKM